MDIGRGYYQYETCVQASVRTGLSEREIRDGIANGSLWWRFNAKRGLYEVAGERVRSGVGAGGCGLEGVLAWIGDFIIGRKYGEGFFVSVIWLLLEFTVMWPITIMGLMIEYAARGEASLIGQSGKSGTTGGGMFDEVSSRRREDLHWMLGIGKYEGRGY